MMVRSGFRLLALLATVAAVPAASTAQAASRTSTTVERRVAGPGTYDVALKVKGHGRADVVDVTVQNRVHRRVKVRARAASATVRMRVQVSGKTLVAHLVARRAKPTVSTSVRRVAAAKKKPGTTTPSGTTAGTTAPGSATGTPSPAPAPSGATTSGGDGAQQYTNLVWSDEFNGAAGALPAAGKWTAETGDGWGNGAEWQTYTANARNASQDGKGDLAIVARREPGVGAHGITSARLTTQGKFSFAYGRLEARMKLPAGKGVWPAFWTLGDDVDSAGWPFCGEIDVMEALGQDPFTAYGHVHGPTASGGDAAWGRAVTSPTSLTAGFHTYGVVWSPTTITWTLDGATYATFTRSDLPAGSRWVYDHNFHVLLDVAVGGTWGGYPDASTPFPATMLVDWVRVYQ